MRKRLYICHDCGSEDVSVYAPETNKGGTGIGIAICNEPKTSREPACGWTLRFTEGGRLPN